MIKFIILLLIFTSPILGKAQDIKLIEQFKTFEDDYLSNLSSDTIYVFNFWATWCKPCVQELPYFDSLNQFSGSKTIKLVLVSLDFESQIESTLKPFIIRQKIINEVIVLTDSDVNTWIDKVDKSWSGSVPATLVLNKNKRLFYEQSFHSYKELLTTILKIEQ
ncbi:MAG: TlpA family protein disulfide reductase [Crocinitomicaceae bacterium]